MLYIEKMDRDQSNRLSGVGKGHARWLKCTNTTVVNHFWTTQSVCSPVNIASCAFSFKVIKSRISTRSRTLSKKQFCFWQDQNFARKIKENLNTAWTCYVFVRLLCGKSLVALFQSQLINRFLIWVWKLESFYWQIG